MERVLFVDDEPSVVAAFRRALRQEAYEICEAHSAQEALALLERQPVDLVVSDERMPGMGGSELLARVRARWPETIRIILTGQATLESAVRAINEGEIWRFLLKPCEATDLAQTIRHALLVKRLTAENLALRTKVEQQAGLLERLERANPGITAVERDEDGAVLIDADTL